MTSDEATRLPGPGGRPNRAGAVRAPNAADQVADELRRRILDGVLAHGAVLAKQDALVDEFGVSLPSIRDALRILETEGLVTVRRGKLGGAVVHRPAAINAAYSLGLVLRARNVSIERVASALQATEPLCAALCAERPDRDDAVLPGLRAAHRAAVDAGSDASAVALALQSFHEQMIAGCGNETLILVIGALDSIVRRHGGAWLDGLLEAIEREDDRQRAIDDHLLLIRLIERADDEGAERAAKHFLEWSGRSAAARQAIEPGLLGDRRPSPAH